MLQQINMNVLFSQRAIHPVLCARIRGPLSVLFLMTSLTGCQCCGLAEFQMTAVDRIADKSCNLECLYCPKLDLTRINRRCGPQCCRHRCQTVACPRNGVFAHRWQDSTFQDEAAVEDDMNPEAPPAESPAESQQDYFPPPVPSETLEPGLIFDPNPAALNAPRLLPRS